MTTDTTGSGLGGVVTWNYSVAASAVEYLAAGQTKVETFTFTCWTATAAASSRTIDVTITGTNDAPIVAATDVTGAVTELVTPVGNLTDSGTIAFTDVDLTDVHSVSAVTASVRGAGQPDGERDHRHHRQRPGWRGHLELQRGGLGGRVSAGGPDQGRDLHLHVLDGHGGSVIAHRQVTITGTNDAPVVAVALTDNAYEGDTAFTTDLLAGATDIDLGETATLSIDNLQYSVDGGTASTILPAGVSLGSDGHTLTIDPTDPAFDYLASGDQTVIVISYGVEDAQGATVTQIETVTIHGTNDVPAIAGVATGDVTEDVAVDNTDHINTTGLLTIADADTGQSSFTAQASTAGSNNYGSFTLAANGTWTYTADNTQAAIQELGANEFITDSFVAVSSDGTASELVTVTIHGTNDVPTIAGVSRVTSP